MDTLKLPPKERGQRQIPSAGKTRRLLPYSMYESVDTISDLALGGGGCRVQVHCAATRPVPWTEDGLVSQSYVNPSRCPPLSGFSRHIWDRSPRPGRDGVRIRLLQKNPHSRKTSRRPPPLSRRGPGTKCSGRRERDGEEGGEARILSRTIEDTMHQ